MAIRLILSGSLALWGVQAAADDLPVPFPDQTFATLGKASVAKPDAHTLAIKQTTAKAILNWQQFNIGKDKTVRFDQPGAAAVALNRIYQNDPSLIQGKLQANGQVYLINQNGFVFGKGAQVDVNSLVASSLAISDDSFNRGITKVVDQDGRAALQGTGVDGQGKPAAVSVERGARLKAAPGGRIILAAPVVENRGSVVATDGQVILAGASDKVYLQEVSDDPGMRGLLVEVGKGGGVANFGKIAADRGNVTLVGFAVAQQGRVSAKTAVKANGSIRLLAREAGAARRDSDHWVLEANSTLRGDGSEATVTLGKDSVTAATPDTADRSTAVDAQTQQASRIEVVGHRIHLAENALIKAKSGQVSLTATERPDAPGTAAARNASRIELDASARIDVSGIKDVSLPMSRNVVSVELRSHELRDAPLQKGGVLDGATVKVDVRKGTGMADISGALERIGRTVAERSTQGGMLDLISEGRVIVHKAAAFDFSGGSLLYRPGYVDTTQLIQDRRIVDIGDADPDTVYDGIVGQVSRTDRHWGVRESWDVAGMVNRGRFEAGYREGQDAGSLHIQAGELNGIGSLDGHASAGLHQRESGKAPRGGGLQLDLGNTPDATQAVVFGNPPAGGDTLALHSDFAKSAGLGRLTIDTGGRIAVAGGSEVQLAAGSRLKLSGSQLDVEGAIRGASAEIDLATRQGSGRGGAGDGSLRLGEDALIDVAGRWHNDLADPDGPADLGAAFIAGGKVSLSAEGDVELAQGSRIDVSGGAWRQNAATLKTGDAGSIAIATQAPGGSGLKLDGELSGYALQGAKGGTLALTANRIEIGPSSLLSEIKNPLPLGEGRVRAEAPDVSKSSSQAQSAQALTPTPLPQGEGLVRLSPGFSHQGGFQHYTLTSNLAGLQVEGGTALDLSLDNRVLDRGASTAPSASSIAAISHVERLPDPVRGAVDLDLRSVQSVGDGGERAAVAIGRGARIETEAGGGIRLSSDTGITIDGALRAPGGTIAATVEVPKLVDPGYVADQAIRVGAAGLLDASGTARLSASPTGLSGGEVLDGGRVELHADRGSLVLEEGSRIDVSGTAAELDVPARVVDGNIIVERRTIASDGGAIDLRAAEGMKLDGRMIGRAGAGGGAGGGELTVELDPSTRGEPDPIGTGQTPFPDVASTITLDAGSDTAAAPGAVVLGAGQVQQGGYTSLELISPDRIELRGDVGLNLERSIVLDAPELAATGDAKVRLDAAYVALGSSRTRPDGSAAVAGAAELSVHGRLIDLIGSQRLDGFASTSLASDGDVRAVGVRTLADQTDFTGRFATAGDLSVTADQLYPTTLSDFTVDSRGRLSIHPGGKGGRVLSAAGGLTLKAPVIEQGGTVKAPLGSLALQATDSLVLKPGSLTSVSAAGRVIPFGRTQGGLDWIYPLGSRNLIFSAQPTANTEALPDKQLALTGKRIDVSQGARVDISGGGRLQAYEFTPGPGGSVDLLDPASPGYRTCYAVLPKLGSAFAAYDPVEFPAAGLEMGDSVHLNGGNGLKAGSYALLPAHYALLPGAFLVTPQDGPTDFLPGRDIQLAGGERLMAGYRKVAGTGFRDSRWSAFKVTPGHLITRRGEYRLANADRFFADQAKTLKLAQPWLPADAGQIALVASESLGLNGSFSDQAAGRSGRLDITSDRIAVVGAGGSPVAGAVNLQDSSLNRLNVGSVLIGGRRRQQQDGSWLLEAGAATVDLDAGARLEGEEILLSAKDGIRFAAGTELSASGSGVSELPSQYAVEGDTAVVAVSGRRDLALTRSGVQGRTGSIDLAAGSALQADGAIVADASADNCIAGDLRMDGGSLRLGARRIRLGDGAEAGGLVLDSARLGELKMDELVLTSGTALDLYGSVGLKLKDLTVHAGALLGHGSASDVARIAAANLSIDNAFGADSSISAEGAGRLQLNAATLALGSGNYRLAGFGQADLTVSTAVTGRGEGVLTADADVAIAAPRWVAAGGARTEIDAAGHDFAYAGTTGDATGPADLGGGLAVTADRLSLENNARIQLPSGQVALTALQGDLRIGAGSAIDVAGREVKLADATRATDGGSIVLSAERGDVIEEIGARLDLSGAKTGALSVTAEQGRFAWEGDIDGGGEGGTLSIRAATLDDSGRAAKLAKTGFDDSLALTQIQGDLAWNGELAARQLAITAERGGLEIGGTLEAQGPGARIGLHAAGNLVVASTAHLAANGTASSSLLPVGEGMSDQDHGTIILDSVGDPAQGAVVLQPGAVVDLRDATGDGAGRLAIRAPRTGGDVAVSGLPGQAADAGRITVEAVRVYRHQGEIAAADIAAWKADTDAYMAHASAIEQRLGLGSGVLAGLEVRSGGDLQLGSAGWDLLSWRYGGEVGVLSLEAAGDLTLAGSLSDGFAAYQADAIDLSGLSGPGAAMAVRDHLQPGPSWSFNLTAGHDLTVGHGAVLRTGSGDIDLRAGRDFRLADASAAVYTAGRPDATSRYGSLSNAAVAFSLFGEYPVDGGDLSVHAGRDVVGAISDQLFDEWLVRTGNWSAAADHKSETPTAWAIALGQTDPSRSGTPLGQSRFRQNLGSFGGGDIEVSAGRDIKDLSVMLPTTGKQVGKPADPANPRNTAFTSNEVAVAGGGDLSVSAGNDIAGGIYYDGRGTASLRAGGDIMGSVGLRNLGPVLALGDTRFDLAAGGDVTVGAVFNPTVLKNGANGNYFFTYGGDSAVSLESLAGSIELQNDVAGLLGAVNALRGTSRQIALSGTDLAALQVYPAKLSAWALQGDVRIDRSFVTYPSASGQLDLIAAGSIASGRLGNAVLVSQSDADPALLPSPLHPAVRSIADAAQRLNPNSPANLSHAAKPLHAGDGRANRIVAAGGDLLGNDPLAFALAKHAEVGAGRDIRNVSFKLQHADYRSSTILAAGDIGYPIPRDSAGQLINLNQGIELSGPGQLWVSAGGDVDLGSSQGIYTLGNRFNPALAERGADVSVWAGMGGAADFDGFAKLFPPTAERYRQELVAYLRQVRGDAIDAGSADAAYQALPVDLQHAFLMKIFFAELRGAAMVAARSGRKADYRPGEAAIAALFPQSRGAYDGDIRLFFSKIHTVDGGDIDLLAPGGRIDAGLAVAFAGAKPPSELGVVAERSGAINAFLDGDFQVNRSRVFTLDGGDITVWSAHGDVDAGRGAKSALAAPPPVVSFDAQGNLVVTFPPVISGSGIRTASTTAGTAPGDVVLAAPSGVVDAGEAGIGGKTVFIPPNNGTVNMGNVNGQTVGVASAVVVPPISPTVGAGLADLGRAATDAATAHAAAASDKDAGATVAAPIAVDLLGFGGCTVEQVRRGEPGCG